MRGGSKRGDYTPFTADAYLGGHLVDVEVKYPGMEDRDGSSAETSVFMTR